LPAITEGKRWQRRHRGRCCDLIFDVHHGAFGTSAQDTARAAVESVVSKPTILIVEDDKAVRHSLRMVLETYGYEVEEFASGEELFDQGQLERSGCVILDVNLPGASGLETLEKMRAMNFALPAIVVSGRGGRNLHERAKGLNAIAFFDKPVDIDALLAAISSIDG
jgi:two-component system response regulator FixJ